MRFNLLYITGINVNRFWQKNELKQPKIWNRNFQAIFSYIDCLLQQTEYIKSRNTDAGDGFGSAIAISGDGNTLIVGAKDEASDGSDFNDNSSSGSGAAYIY